MDWFIIVGCGLMGWVALCVISGERVRRMQALEVERMAQNALANEAA